MASNPLLNPLPWPAFSRIRPEHVMPAVEQAISHHDAAISAIRLAPLPDLNSALYAREQADAQLDSVWSPASHLEMVADTPELREACQKARTRLTAYRTGIRQDDRLRQMIDAVAQSPEMLTPPERRALSLASRSFRLAGVTLPEDERARIATIQVELGRLTTAFGNAVLDATDSWFLHIEDEKILSGVPDAERGALRAAARTRGVDGWMLTLQAPSVQAILTHADDRGLREAIYRAFQTRASDQGPDVGRHDNGPRMTEILRLRAESSRLLGFHSYAARSLFVKMAKDVDEVTGLLINLAAAARPFAETELADLQAIASDLGVTDLQPWDVAFFSEKLRRERYLIDQTELRRYFPLERVLEGLFSLLKTLFGVELLEKTSAVDRWNDDVRYFAVLSENSELGGFYLDPFVRRSKRGGAWMNPSRPRLGNGKNAGVAVAHLVCNFTPPHDGQPALLTHQEVVTLFHEMGHCLHHLLSEVGIPSIAGISGFEWDAVEWPSQLMEAFAWEPEVLQRCSAHIESGEPLPRDLIEGLGRARTFQAGLMLLRQIELALFDLRIHHVTEPSADTVQTTMTQVRSEIAVLRLPEWTRFPNSFTHVFSGGYAAGYYSYLWAERLAADAFEAFVKEGRIDRSAGARFRAEVLARGASRQANESFTAFRGREVTNQALLRRRGLVAVDDHCRR